MPYIIVPGFILLRIMSDSTIVPIIASIEFDDLVTYANVRLNIRGDDLKPLDKFGETAFPTYTLRIEDFLICVPREEV